MQQPLRIVARAAQRRERAVESQRQATERWQETIQQASRAGFTTRAIGEAAGVSHETVAKIVRNGIPVGEES
jgi:hypothetical protein